MKTSNIGFVHCEHNAADAMGKSKQCAALYLLVQDSVLDHPFDEWVLRHDIFRSRKRKYGQCRTDVVHGGENYASTYLDGDAAKVDKAGEGSGERDCDVRSAMEGAKGGDGSDGLKQSTDEPSDKHTGGNYLQNCFRVCLYVCGAGGEYVWHVKGTSGMR